MLKKLIALFVFVPLFLAAQDIDAFVSRYSQENGKAYMQPLVDVFGAGLNSGIIAPAKIPIIGLNFEIGARAMITIIPDDAKTFMATTEGVFEPQTTVEAPTIFGDTVGPTVEGQGGASFVFPGGFGFSRLPVAVPQLTIGSVFGTQATLRYFQMDLPNDFGELNVIGYGLRHSISQYIPLLPLDISAHLFLQSFDVGEIVEASAAGIGVAAGRGFGILDVYGGVAWETAALDVSYDFESPSGTENLSYSLTSETAFRLTVGAGLDLLFVKLMADYSILPMQVLNVGLSVGL